MATGRVPADGRIVGVSPASTGMPTASPTAGRPGSKKRYVNQVGSDGWLRTRDEATGSFLFLTKYTAVSMIDAREGRTTFKVLDGPHRHRVLSLTDANARSHLGLMAPDPTPAQITVTYGAYTPGWVSVARGGEQLDQQLAVLDVGRLSVAVTMNSVWGTGFFPLPKGVYDVLLPDAPHKAGMTRFYRVTEPSLHADQVWFPIRFGNNSRYVHVGNVSDGCVTVLDLARWADVHEALLRHRSADGLGVGHLTVQGTPGRVR
ncbi:hypothetical protein [uncultured Sphaerotilus sp.]|uniref:hypothetical protein n=1 Tax=uncultured Sphaerotilus sp. TaxID=474984 RepID=UPI0030CA1988